MQEKAQAASARVDKTLYYLSLACHGALLVMFRRTAIVYLPSAWTVPFGWLLAFPAAPSGTRVGPRSLPPLGVGGANVNAAATPCTFMQAR